PLLHQQADDVDSTLRHAVGEILNRDRLGDRHFAHQLFLWLGAGVTLEALRAAAERGDRALAHFVCVHRRDDGEPAALFFKPGARSRSRGRCRPVACATPRAGRVIVFRFKGRPTRRDGFAEALLGDFAGLALGFLVVLAALFLTALTRLGGLALGAGYRLAAGAAARFFLGDAAFLGVPHARIRERMGARITFFFRERAEDDAGLRRR